MPADQPAPEAAGASTPKGSRTATGTRAPRTSAAAAKTAKTVTAAAEPAAKPAPRKKAPAKSAAGKAKPTVVPAQLQNDAGIVGAALAAHERTDR